MTPPRVRLGGAWATAREFDARLAANLGAHGVLLDPAAGRARVCDEDLAEAGAEAWVDDAGDLHLRRDAIGHRSLYWGRPAGGGVVFASSISALIRSRALPLTVSPHGLALYLSCAYVPGASTLIDGVSAVRGGEELVFSRLDPQRAPSSQRFWTLPASPARFDPEDALRDRLRSFLEAAVRDRRPPAGAPVGASLSGGIDSSAVVALLARVHDGPIETYSVWFGPEHGHELEFSRAVAAHVGVPHHVVEVRPEHIVAELDRTVAALAEPNGDPLTVPNSLIFRAAAERSPILFNGEGGDPCFGGPKNAPMLLASLLGDPARSPAADYLSAHQRGYDELDRMLHPDIAARIPERALEWEVLPWLQDARWPGFLDRLMAINVTWKGAHHILPKVDQLACAEGMWPRSPLFDRRLVELAFAIPGALKRRGAEEKYLFKSAVSDLLPAEIVHRPKSGMMVPVEAWFTGPLRAMARERLMDGLTGWSVVRRDYLSALLDGPPRGLRPRRGIKIWLLLTLEAWLRTLTS